MATVFVIGSLVSLAALAGAGQVSLDALYAAGVLIPFMVAGFALSGPARRVLDAGWTRRAVLTLATASAVALIADSVLG